MSLLSDVSLLAVFNVDRSGCFKEREAQASNYLSICLKPDKAWFSLVLHPPGKKYF